MNNSSTKITTKALSTLLDNHFPEYRKRVVHNKDLHPNDIESLLSEIEKHGVTYQEIVHAIDTLKPYADNINNEYKQVCIVDSPFIKKWRKDKMYQVGIGRLILDITHLRFRKRITHSSNKVELLNKWHLVFLKEGKT